MKNFTIGILAIAALALTPTVANAMPAELCPSIGELAETIMKSRQSGIPKTVVMSAVSPGLAHDLAVSIINVAYAVPIYPIDRMRNTAIENFRMQTEYMCYQTSTN